jgi:hypothetical protein
LTAPIPAHVTVPIASGALIEATRRPKPAGGKRHNSPAIATP